MMASIPSSVRIDAAASICIDEFPVAYIETDAEGTVTRANRIVLALHPASHGELIGRKIWDLLADDERARSFAAFLELMASGEEPPIIYRPVFIRSGAWRTFELHRNLIRDSAGKITGLRMIGFDVTAMKAVYDEACRAQYWLQSEAQSRTEAIVLTDGIGAISQMNSAAEKLLGWSAAEITGQMIDVVLPILSYQPAEGRSLDLRAMAERRCKGSARVLTRAQQEIEIEIETAAVLEPEHQTICGIATILRNRLK
jgi:PAS domain S-box-containing protein